MAIADTSGQDIALAPKSPVRRWGNLAASALGVDLSAGEKFGPDDIAWRNNGDTQWLDKAVIPKAMAEALFPDDLYAAVGSTVYIGADEPMTVIGILDRLQAPWNGRDGVERSVLVPQRLTFNSSRSSTSAGAPGRLVRGARSAPRDAPSCATFWLRISCSPASASSSAPSFPSD